MIVIISDGGGRLQFKNTRLGLSLRSGTLAVQVIIMIKMIRMVTIVTILMIISDDDDDHDDGFDDQNSDGLSGTLRCK